MPGKLEGIRLKRWRYVAAFADPFMVCAARAQVGPVGQTFWAIVDREADAIHTNTRLRLPGARGEVWREEREGRQVDRMMAGDTRMDLIVGEGRWHEAVCPTQDGAYVWTRKRCDVPVTCDVRVEGKRWKLDARGVEDESAGYHPKHTVWRWSAGVGHAVDGRSIGWNLVEGINDPPTGSERAIWVDGEPSEAPPSHFHELDAIAFDDGSKLDFNAEQERSVSQNLPMVSYEYRQPFGTFNGSLPGGIVLRDAMGVMEHHDAHW